MKVKLCFAVAAVLATCLGFVGTTHAQVPAYYRQAPADVGQKGLEIPHRLQGVTGVGEEGRGAKPVRLDT